MGNLAAGFGQQSGPNAPGHGTLSCIGALDTPPGGSFDPSKTCRPCATYPSTWTRRELDAVHVCPDCAHTREDIAVFTFITISLIARLLQCQCLLGAETS